jgi:cytochrome oxidase Cu insertion factor (SCO1/SenC/PrrC family)
MKPSLSKKHIFHIVVTLLLTTVAMVLIFTSHQLIAAMNSSTLNGIETRLQLNKDVFQLNEVSTKPLLITALFSTCKSICPDNISQLRKINSAHQGHLDYLFINLKPDEGSAKLLREYLSEFAPNMQLILPQSEQELVALMSSLPENFSLNNSNVHHSGNIYLYHPKGKGLIIYRKPDSKQIIDDLSILQLRGN